MARYQKVTHIRPDRKDHVWFRLDSGGFKCALCGAVTQRRPPDYPTPDNWMPDRYEPVSSEEADMCPRSDQ